MVNGQRNSANAEAMNGVPKGSRAQCVFVSLLLGCGIATGLYREAGIFSRLIGPVDVHLSIALDTNVFAPPAGDVLLRTALWLVLILCVGALRVAMR